MLFTLVASDEPLTFVVQGTAQRRRSEYRGVFTATLSGFVDPRNSSVTEGSIPACAGELLG